MLIDFKIIINISPMHLYYDDNCASYNIIIY